MIDFSKLLTEYSKKNYHLLNPREVKSGKEATLYLVTWNNKDVALKVYANPEHRSFQTMSNYIAGKYHRNPSERKAVLKKAKYGRRLIHRSWVQREFHMLQKVRQAGATVPEVYECSENSILMEFIGSDGQAAPRLIDITLTKTQADQSLKLLLKDIQIFLQCGIIHGDLSPYNILWWNDKPVIIDIPQAIDIRENPNKDKILARDIFNLLQYFKKFTQVDEKTIYSDLNISPEQIQA